MATYPEHEKLKVVTDQVDACGEFLDWLLGPQRYVIGEYHQHDEACGGNLTTPTCNLSTEFLRPAPVNTRKLLAKFFGIDEEKLEAEKRAMLADLKRRR